MRPRWLSKHVRCGFYALCRHLSAPAMTCLTAVRYFNVPDIGRLGGVLIASNHQSYLDPLLVGIALERPIHYLAQRDLFRVPGLGLLIVALGAHPVIRGKADSTALRRMVEVLRGGEPLLLFPEGTRTLDGCLGPFRSGVGSIAVRCQVPVLPVCIEGAFRSWPRTRRLPVPARVAVAFGELLWPKGRNGRALTRIIARRIAHMQGLLRKHLGRSAEASRSSP